MMLKQQGYDLMGAAFEVYNEQLLDESEFVCIEQYQTQFNQRSSR